MPNLPDVVLWSIPAFVLLTVVEIVTVRLHPDEEQAGYETKDAATSVTMGIGSLGFDLLWKIPIVAVYTLAYELTPLRVPVLWWTVPLVLLAQDFFYYWSHRGHHVIRILWACHVVHHSSRRFNLTTALRQPWTSLTSWPFYLPLILLGVHPAVLAFCSSVNLVYQFGIHTERIGGCRARSSSSSTPLPPPGPPRLPGRLPGPQLRRHPHRLGPPLRLLRRRDRPPRLRSHQEHRDLQPAARRHPRVRRHRPGRPRRHHLARTGGRVFRGPGWSPEPPAGTAPATATPAPEATR
ncbi:sterol desaturase family protein [Actinomadura keratinilytica]